mmetsp:Transcript_96171/g.272267  ORF Transcript_96171/g.272267 Transcript_96171/m.272267 type:complete len:445 (+) Transcript_96171:283-1617(+)
MELRSSNMLLMLSHWRTCSPSGSPMDLRKGEGPHPARGGSPITKAQKVRHYGEHARVNQPRQPPLRPQLRSQPHGMDTGTDDVPRVTGSIKFNALHTGFRDPCFPSPNLRCRVIALLLPGEPGGAPPGGRLVLAIVLASQEVDIAAEDVHADRVPLDARENAPEGRAERAVYRAGGDHALHAQRELEVEVVVADVVVELGRDGEAGGQADGLGSAEHSPDEEAELQLDRGVLARRLPRHELPQVRHANLPPVLEGHAADHRPVRRRRHFLDVPRHGVQRNAPAPVQIGDGVPGVRAPPLCDGAIQCAARLLEERPVGAGRAPLFQDPLVQEGPKVREEGSRGPGSLPHGVLGGPHGGDMQANGACGRLDLREFCSVTMQGVHDVQPRSWIAAEGSARLVPGTLEVCWLEQRQHRRVRRRQQLCHAFRSRVDLRHRCDRRRGLLR